MDKSELYLKADEIAERITTDTLLMNIMMAMSQDELEGILKYIDTAFETNIFDN